MKVNNILMFTLSIFSIINLFGCKNELMSYEGEEGVYFSVQYGSSWGDTTKWSYYPLTKIEFINAKVDDSTHYIRVASTGSIKDYDRQFKMIIETDSTTAILGQNFDEVPELHTIKAGEYFTDIPIVLHKNENITRQEKRITFKLVPTSDFTLSIPIWDSNIAGLWPNNEYKKFDNTRHSILLTNFLVRPKVWMGAPLADAPVGTVELGYFGQFTVKKFNLMCEVMKKKGRIITYADFASETTMPSPLLTVIKDAMVQYLTEQHKAKTPILEEDGRLMFCSGVSWTSSIGIPYVPEL